jgi:hypothetical protein
MVPGAHIPHCREPCAHPESSIQGMVLRRLNPVLRQRESQACIVSATSIVAS